MSALVGTRADGARIAGIDIDGVLADPTHRLHHLSAKPRNWHGFFSEAKDDSPLKVGIDLVQELASGGHEIVYVSGRPEGLRADTLDWFQRYDVPEAELILRPHGDHRPAPTWKLAVYRELSQDRTIETIVDDDLRVVRKLEQAGFPILHADWYQPPPEDKSRLAQAQDKLGRT